MERRYGAGVLPETAAQVSYFRLGRTRLILGSFALFALLILDVSDGGPPRYRACFSMAGRFREQPWHRLLQAESDLVPCDFSLSRLAVLYGCNRRLTAEYSVTSTVAACSICCWLRSSVPG